MLTGLLVVIVLLQIVGVVRAWPRPEPPTTPPPDPPPQRHRKLYDVFVPVGCGIAVKHGPLTMSCRRTPGHQGRCMCEEELVAAAELTTTIVASVTDVDREVDVVSLGKHADACPASLFEPGRLDAGEAAWLRTTRLKIEALANGRRFEDFGETRA